jgi:hypothetical protein
MYVNYISGVHRIQRGNAMFSHHIRAVLVPVFPASKLGFPVSPKVGPDPLPLGFEIRTSL